MCINHDFCTNPLDVRYVGSNGLSTNAAPLLSLVESRCGAVALGRTYLLPPLSSGGALVVQPWLRFHIPLIEPDRQISRIRLSDKTSRFASRATPSAASEHLSELIGFPISMSFTTCCVCLELRSLSSTGITRLQWYYEPLRHPRAPDLSLTGFRLVLADHALGLPVFAYAFLVYMLSPLPRRSVWAYCFAHFTQPYQPSPKGSSGRPAHRPFRGLLSVHSRYGPHTCAATNSWLAYPKASTISLPP